MTYRRQSHATKWEREISSETMFKIVAAIILILILGAFGAFLLALPM